MPYHMLKILLNVLNPVKATVNVKVHKIHVKLVMEDQSLKKDQYLKQRDLD